MTIFHTSPTAIRMLRKVGPEEPKKYDYHFKHMTTVGEPIEPEVWRWYHSVVGKGEAVIVDTWWQTENGGFLGSTLPALQPMKPGSCGPGVLGIYQVIWDEDGNEIAEAAAVPVIDELRGRVVEMYVSLKPGLTPSKEIEGKVVTAVETEIGKIARPKTVWIVADMPKTRSGKIMRRVIASVSNFTDVGDVSTLANPEIVDEIRHHVQAQKAARGEVPRELTTEEAAEIKAFGQAE